MTMPNAHLFDSDRDYQDACLTPAQRMANAIIDGEDESLLDQYLVWTAINKVEQLVEQVEWVDEFTRWKIDIEGEP